MFHWLLNKPLQINVQSQKNTQVHLAELFNSFMTEVLSYRNQSIDLLCKSMDWLLCDWGLRHKRVKVDNKDTWALFWCLSVLPLNTFSILRLVLLLQTLNDDFIAGSKFYNLLFRVKGSLPRVAEGCCINHRFVRSCKVDSSTLTIPTRCISESYIKTKINLNLYFHISLWYLKRFYEGL